MCTFQIIRKRLLSMEDVPFREFQAPLIPGVKRMIGIRMPRLRLLAKEFLRGSYTEWLHEVETTSEPLYFEEVMLWGILIGTMPCTVEERLMHTEKFIPRIDNWAVCDCCAWQVKEQDKNLVWQFLLPYFHSQQTYHQRFAEVMSLKSFLTEDYLTKVFHELEAVHATDYYSRMGIAWAVSIAYIHHREETLKWFEQHPLDDWTFNKAIQKIRESQRISPTEKAEVLVWKRK